VGFKRFREDETLIFPLRRRMEKRGKVIGRWPHEHQTLTSASGVLSAEARAGERASNAVVLK
jgi:hypothetical protein